MRIGYFASLLLGLGLAAGPAFGVCRPSSDVLASLRCLDGVDVEEVSSTVAGYRQFELEITQPVDHHAPDGAKFKQRLVLLHHGWDDPMVLQTSGYQIFGVSLTKLARTFQTNQVQVEHRYFAGSTPEDLDWTKLDIEQSAADFHAVVVALRQLYLKKWVNTGASKGGMTSVFHRRFYPTDLDGTVADVAPLSFSQDDERYPPFVDAAGGERWTQCRQDLERLQHTLLTRRDELEPDIQGGFEKLGKDTAYEHAVIELPFAFWQYGNPTDPSTGCSAIPGPDADPSALSDYLAQVNNVADGYGDDGFVTFQSYYFQAGTQLGGPAAKLSHLRDERHHDYSLSMYMPEGNTVPYSNAAMLDVKNWVETQAEGIMFVYGEFDPWSAGAFPAGAPGHDMYKYVVPGGNHGSQFTLLAPEDRAEAVGTLSRWLERDPVTDVRSARRGASLEDIELAARRKLHLP
jgi:hypothetical protein